MTDKIAIFSTKNTGLEGYLNTFLKAHPHYKEIRTLNDYIAVIYNNNNNEYSKEFGKELGKELDETFDNGAGNDTTNSIHNNIDEIKSEED